MTASGPFRPIFVVSDAVWRAYLVKRRPTTRPPRKINYPHGSAESINNYVKISRTSTTYTIYHGARVIEAILSRPVPDRVNRGRPLSHQSTRVLTAIEERNQAGPRRTYTHTYTRSRRVPVFAGGRRASIISYHYRRRESTIRTVSWYYSIRLRAE